MEGVRTCYLANENLRLTKTTGDEGNWRFSARRRISCGGISKLAQGWGSAASGKIESRRMSGRSVALNTVSLQGSRRRILMPGPWLVHTQRKSLSKARPLNARDLNSPFVDNGVISWRGQVESRFESLSVQAANVVRPLFDNHCDRGFGLGYVSISRLPTCSLSNRSMQACTAWFRLRLLFLAAFDSPSRDLIQQFSTFRAAKLSVVLKITSFISVFKVIRGVFWNKL